MNKAAEILGGGVALATLVAGGEAVNAAEPAPVEVVMTLEEVGQDTFIDAEGLKIRINNMSGTAAELGAFVLPQSDISPDDPGFNWLNPEHKAAQYSQRQIGDIAVGTGELEVDLEGEGLECGDFVQPDVTTPGTIESVGPELTEAEADQAIADGNVYGGTVFEIVCYDENGKEVPASPSENGQTGDGENLARTGANIGNLVSSAGLLIGAGAVAVALSRDKVRNRIKSFAKDLGLSNTSN